MAEKVRTVSSAVQNVLVKDLDSTVSNICYKIDSSNIAKSINSQSLFGKYNIIPSANHLVSLTSNTFDSNEITKDFNQKGRVDMVTAPSEVNLGVMETFAMEDLTIAIKESNFSSKNKRNTSNLGNVTTNPNSHLQLAGYNPSGDGISTTAFAYSSAKQKGKLATTGYKGSGKSCRFPKLEECAHFHYERVQLGPLSVRLVDDKSELLNNSIASQSIGEDTANVHQSISAVSGVNRQSTAGGSFSPANCWFIIKVCPHQCETFLVKRSFENVTMLDEMLHQCVYDRKISGLKNLNELDFKDEEEVEYAVAKYLERFSKIASDSLTCGTILTWLQLDNKGRRLPLADGDTQRTINTPAVGAAYGVRRYQAQASDEISIEVGDMISVIDMPTPAESIWWRGKKSHLQKSQYEVGFFPQSCVATIGEKIPRHIPMPAPLVGQLDVSPTKPVLRKHGKLIAFFRSFILSRPSRRKLKQSGIYRERVFSCDLSEHLLNSGQEIPMVLKCCAEFIEKHGILDGIYRLSGITSNIQRLRRAFDEERVPDLSNPEVNQDIHAVSSLLKMYFRELPNPLCTYQLYDKFVDAIQIKSESKERLRLVKETVLKLPPPHYRTLQYLAEHLNKISQYAGRTGMTEKNLAIVWAPNLLRSPILESGGVAALKGVGVQAVVTEFLIRNCQDIFESIEEKTARLNFVSPAEFSSEIRMDSVTDCDSLLVEQRDHDQSILNPERPKSISTGGPKLISLEEAQERHSRVDSNDINKSININIITSYAPNIGSYIEVGGGPSSLPDKYHTVLSVPRNWHKRKTHSWKSLFTRNQARPGNENLCNDFSVTTKKLNNVQNNMIIEDKFSMSSRKSVTNNKASKDSSSKLKLFKNNTTSVDSFEKKDDVVKLVNACAGSSSIDRFRTIGHSRSVSHDSYFDLLQSPQRSQTNYPSSLEISELCLNFDREEAEMKIFSDSERLDCSQRIDKENVPPLCGSLSSRMMRYRLDEISKAIIFNQSGKRQDRLNNVDSDAVSSSFETQKSCVDEEQSYLTDDKSYCKRYKLEDHLSDIQYIDSAPSDLIESISPTVFISVANGKSQQSATSTTCMYETLVGMRRFESPNDLAISPQKKGSIVRYSYPYLQWDCKIMHPTTRRNAASQFNLSIRKNVEEDSTDKGKSCENSKLSATRSSLLSDRLQVRFRCSSQKSMCAEEPTKDCRSSDRISNNSIYGSIDVNAEASDKLMHLVSPNSSLESPGYSLLIGETSSENSSILNTPQEELQPQNPNFDSFNFIQPTCIKDTQQERDFSFDNMSVRPDTVTLKKETSLYLKSLKTNVDGLNYGRPEFNLIKDNAVIKQMNIMVSPTNSNYADTTSYSVTRSDFDYQNLDRNQSVLSLIDTVDKLPLYKGFEKTPFETSLVSDFDRKSEKVTSPIKSTISITYKSPGKPNAKKTLLETSFNEITDYEQVKLFKDSITEVNQILADDNTNYDLKSTMISNEMFHTGELWDKKGFSKDAEAKRETEAILDAIPKTVGSIRSQIDSEVDSLLYQNVLMKKPKTVYENLKGEYINGVILRKKTFEPRNNFLESETEKISDTTPESSETKVKKTTSFTVKTLANKFESSSDVQLPNFDVSVHNTKKKLTYDEAPVLRTSPQSCKRADFSSIQVKQKLLKMNQFTRSLDESAFNREFGNKYIFDINTRSTQHMKEWPEKSSRRKNSDITGPKVLNSPKRLPGTPIAEIVCSKFECQLPTLKAEKKKNELNNCKAESSVLTDFLEHDFEPAELKESLEKVGHIAILQQNKDPSRSYADLNNSNFLLSGVKLDRERIDKIKEERRLQLTQRYGLSFSKSLSKTDLNASTKCCDKNLNCESLKILSKSRGNIPLLRTEDSLKQLSRSSASMISSEDIFNNTNLFKPRRARSIYDDKNQNRGKNADSAIATYTENTLSNKNMNNLLWNAADGDESFNKNTDSLLEELSARSAINRIEGKSLSIINRTSSDMDGAGTLGSGGSASAGIRQKYNGSNQDTSNFLFSAKRNSIPKTREKISPQFSIRDVTAMFESRSQNHH